MKKVEFHERVLIFHSIIVRGALFRLGFFREKWHLVFQGCLGYFQKKYYLKRECVKMMHSLCASCAGE